MQHSGRRLLSNGGAARGRGSQHRTGQANGHTVVLLHGNNFAGFYFGGPIDALRNEGFRVVVPDQIGYGRSSKPIIPYNFHDMARHTRLVLQSLKIEKAIIVGDSGFG